MPKTAMHSKEWALSPRIYIENIRGRNPAYNVNVESVKKAPSSVCNPTELVCRFSDEHDIEAWRRADILIAGRLDTSLIASDAINLKLIQCTSAGVENYAPFDWLRPAVTLTNASGVHAAKVAEFGLMAALMLHDGVPAIASNQKHHLWKRQLKGLAVGRRVLIYGVGALGGAIALSLHTAGFHITGVRKSGKSHDAVDKMIKPEAFHNELKQTDILVLACPLTPETQGLMGVREFEALPKGASILNIARAGIVEQDALVTSLKTGHISGAILDVFDNEPLPTDDAIWDVPNLMV